MLRKPPKKSSFLAALPRTTWMELKLEVSQGFAENESCRKYRTIWMNSYINSNTKLHKPKKGKFIDFQLNGIVILENVR